jgi:uncharacterized phage protein (TIGR02220 family)
MQYSFLGFSVSNMMELNLDMKDVAILRYFIDFKDSGNMHFEMFEGEKYYWVNYRTLEQEMPYLGLGKKAIMTRMLKLKSLGILLHYTKKDGGTFSFFTLGPKIDGLLANNKNKLDRKKEEDNNGGHSDKQLKIERFNKNKDNCKNYVDKQSSVENITGDNDNNAVEYEAEDKEENMDKHQEKLANYDMRKNQRNNSNETMHKGVNKKVQGVHENSNREQKHVHPILEKEERVSVKTSKGYPSKCPTKTNLLNNSSTKEINNIKGVISEIIDYLNSKLGTNYSSNSKSNIRIIISRVREGFSLENFKTVIDKKVSEWLGTEFERYLTPSTLFGAKFEIYLNQKVISESIRHKNNYEPPKLRFNNFKGRDYDYADLERKLLGWA